ncbi:hypothetical protein BN1012_Phect1188 [Candidatus Phaeomarinobacter ectocarpi]|uniref:H-type lectin domain-containing protein n=1 Tax=Candidatus Phaeomarinibacter ectocarpi TaxID=1458461 RepID=X5MCP5_9HYPH|nr:H-type lectin domain-containing protein [Candidatus Phaeomarinobacter ectocarpi]CDO59402.1 hypothetical protein BN1012_Phect1188 [Candidatus Phaeomarinobacter ectocarpi]
MAEFSDEQRAALRGLIDAEVRGRTNRNGGGTFGVLSFLLLVVLAGGLGFFFWVNQGTWDWRNLYADGGGGGDNREVLSEFLLRQAESITDEVRFAQREVSSLRGQQEQLRDEAEEIAAAYRKLAQKAAKAERMISVAEDLDRKLDQVAGAVASSGAVQSVLADKLMASRLQAGTFECGHAYRPTEDGWEEVMTRTVSFESGFTSPPKVFLAPNLLEAYYREPNVILAFEAGSITENKFDLTIRAAGASTISDCRVDWIAVGSVE